MRLILFVIISLAAGYGLIRVSSFGHGGYVKMFVGDYLVEVKLLPFLLALLLTIFVCYVLMRFLVNLFRAPRKYGDWRDKRNQNTSQKKLGDGFLALMKGDWKRAEKQLLAKAEYSKVPFVNYLAAAQAAQEQGKYQQRDYYLSQASVEAPKDKLAISMTKARLHQQAAQHDDALATLRDVEPQGKRNPQFMAMLIQAYDQVDDFEGIQEMLPKVRRMGALPKEVLDEIQQDVDLNIFDSANDKESAWKSLNKVSKQQPEFIKVFAEHQLRNNNPDAAEKLIRTTLRNTWSDDLVNTYGQINSTQRKKLLRNLEGWLLARPENAQLNLAVGRLAMQNQKAQRAEEAFQAAIKLASLPEAYEELGRLYEQGQDLRKALTLYRTGLTNSNSTSGVKALPSELDSELDSGLESETVDAVVSDDIGAEKTESMDGHKG